MQQFRDEIDVAGMERVLQRLDGMVGLVAVVRRPVVQLREQAGTLALEIGDQVRAEQRVDAVALVVADPGDERHVVLELVEQLTRVVTTGQDGGERDRQRVGDADGPQEVEGDGREPRQDLVDQVVRDGVVVGREVGEEGGGIAGFAQ